MQLWSRPLNHSNAFEVSPELRALLTKYAPNCPFKYMGSNKEMWAAYLVDVQIFAFADEIAMLNPEEQKHIVLHEIAHHLNHRRWGWFYRFIPSHGRSFYRQLAKLDLLENVSEFVAAYIEDTGTPSEGQHKVGLLYEALRRQKLARRS